MTIEQSILQLLFPEGVFEWFDVVDGNTDDAAIRITFEEKNIPPRTPAHENKHIISKGFTNITISDFPIRGKRSLLTFRRRYWQVEGEKGALKRDIELAFHGTQLEKEFASFLKKRS